MSNYSDLIHTEIQTESKMSNDPKKPSCKETNENDLANAEELTCDNEIFGDVLKKIKAFINKSKAEKLEKNILIDECRIFKDFFNLIETNEKNLTDEDLLVIKRGLELLINAARSIDSYDTLRTDLDYIKDIFYMYFNLINLNVIKNYFKNVEMSDDLKMLCHICISEILLIIFKSSLYTNLDLNDLQRPNNCIEILSLMINYVKMDLKSSNVTVQLSYNNTPTIRHLILGVINNYANKTIMIPDVIKAGCLEIMIDGLRMICKAPEAHYDILKEWISIIYNSSRHDDGVKQLNALNAVSVIVEFEDCNKDTTLNTKCCMSLALILAPEQIKRDCKCMNNTMDTLLGMLYDASVSSDYRHHPSFHHLSELLVVFIKAFNDDCTLDYIMEDSQVDLRTSTHLEFFINLLINYHSTVSNDDHHKWITCTALVNILWSVSFQDRYKQKLKNSSTQFKNLIQNLTKETDKNISSHQYVPHYIENIQKAAIGLLVNIDEFVHPPTKHVNDTSSGIDNDKKPTIMISYSHQNTEFCKQLYNEILKREHDVWIDFKFLKTGDLWEQIAAGMTSASVIICLLSEDYCKSKSCRLEATYALDKLQANKSIIPVFLQHHELPFWLDIRISTLKYIRFLDSKQLEFDKLIELIDAIEDGLPKNVPRKHLSLHPPIIPVHHEPASILMTKPTELTILSNNILPVNHDEPAQIKTTGTKFENQDISSKNGFVPSETMNQSLYPEKPIEQWNKNDISQWFQHNKILTELQQLCHFEDGYELLDYAKIFLDTKKLQYQMYSEEFLRRDGITLGEKPLLLHEFTKFSNALRKLERSKKSA